MSEDASVRYRDKRVSRAMAGLFGAIALLNLVFAVFVGFKNATLSQPAPAAVVAFILLGLVAFSAMFAGIGLTFAVLRTVVTDRELIVKYALWGPRIALGQITSCKVVDYKWTRFGGWGIRRGAGGVWAYVPGPGPVVEIHYTDGGQDKCVQIGAKDTAALAAEIQSARAALPGVRIDAGSDADALAEAEAVAEQEALEASERETARARQGD